MRQLSIQPSSHCHTPTPPGETKQKRLTVLLSGHPHCPAIPRGDECCLMRSPKQPANIAMLLLLALLLLCDGVVNVVHCSTVHENSIDLQALIDFKHGITNDPHGALSNWSTSTHFCQWNGVNCTRTRPFRVTRLKLTDLDLAGQISSSLGNLTYLIKLDLSLNNFVGPLPILGLVHRLETLYLNNNQLNGIIPDSLTNCSNLAYLDFSSNLLMGVIPRELAFLSNLLYIDFRSNQLKGSISDEFGKLSNLEQLFLGENMLSGEFPRAILNLSSLKAISLETNMLGKSLPPNIGDLLPNLIEITLGGNMFEGHIPPSLGNAPGLELIDLSSNNFTGHIPTSFGKLPNLTILNLELNQLEARDSRDWEFLNALRNCQSLNVLSLTSNQLRGPIPQSIGNLSPSLEHLMLYGNSLSGQVPQNIGRLRALTKLALGGNNLSGTIEGRIGNLKDLQSLNLHSNNFTGPIPSSIGNLTQLTYLYVGENDFEGPVASLGNLPLLDLVLSSNNLQGCIPATLGNLQELIFLNLSHNNLQGDIPQISNLKQLVVLDLSSNKLTGQIPDSMGQCYSLVSLQMDHNFLAGNIPINFGKLLSLSMLNLSHNNLSGTIPVVLSKLEYLINLDLSYNHLEGELPINGVFGNATAVSLEANWGLCGGAIVLNMPMCHAVSQRSKTLYYLVRVLIPLFGFMSLVMLTYIIFFGKKTSRRTYSFLLSFAMKFPRVAYNDLARATKNFSESNLVGRGSYGSVYRGKLTQAKIQVTIKVFDLDMRCADKSFVTECEVLSSIWHRNIVPILTACATIDNNGDAFKALVYEFMPNGNLDTWLHNNFSGSSSKYLSLAQRASIAIGIADALAYLHHDCVGQIVHCDLKPTNILLDDDMNAYLGGFGIASLIGHSSSHSSTRLKGTIGYIAPEYAQSGQASIRGDIYSFGVVLLEMLICKRPTDPMFENELKIVNFVETNYPDNILPIMDARLHGEHKGYIEVNTGTGNAAYGCLLSLMQVALSCTRMIPRERMDIREVTNRLHSIGTSYIKSIQARGGHASLE